MSSMTATLTPAQEGKLPLRLAAPTTSYWDTLEEVDRLASINAYKFRKLGRKTGWFPAGVVLKKWTEEIYPTITRIMNDAGNYERIFGRHNKEVTRPCWLYMVGEGQQWRTARPTIVAICSKTRVAQRICELLENIAYMRTWNLGFDYMHYKEKVVLVTGDSDSSIPPNPIGNLCGLQVLASTYPASLNAKWKQTTAGGTLKINHQYYCLSVAHAFHLDIGEDGSDSSLDSDDESDELDDFHNISNAESSVSVVACRPDALENVNLGLYLDSGPISTSAQALRGDWRSTSISADDIRVIGSGPVTSATTPRVPSLILCVELDWILVQVNDPQFSKPNLVQAPSGMMLSPQQVSNVPPQGKVLVAAGVSGVFESSCEGIVGGLVLPGSSQMVDVWTIESVCLPGDCGSWVIDPITGNIYGIIIATAPEAQESYMVPAYQVYDSIVSKLPVGTTVEFPTSNDAGNVVATGSPRIPLLRSPPSSRTMDTPKPASLRNQAKLPLSSVAEIGIAASSSQSLNMRSLIDIISFIIGVAGAGFRLSVILHVVGSEVASAGQEIHSISKGISLFSLMLKQVGQVLQAPDSIHTHEAELVAKQITNECQQVFHEIEYMLNQVRTRRQDGSYAPTTFQKFKWVFKKNKVTYLLAQLESLKLSLSVMLQILQLAKLMAAPTMSDVQEAAAARNEAIKQERFETQNIIIVRHWQMRRLDPLYNAAKREDMEDRRAEADFEAPPDYSKTSALTKLPVYSLGQLDRTLHRILQSPKDMLQASDQVIDPLLHQWTILDDVRARNERRDSGELTRYVPSVGILQEGEKHTVSDKNLHGRKENPRGYFLEGETTDWHQPQSAAAQRKASQRRKQYTNYQPTIDVDETGEEEGVRVPSNRVARHHVIDSSSESSESEIEEKPRQRWKNSSTPYSPPHSVPGSRGQSYTGNEYMPSQQQRLPMSPPTSQDSRTSRDDRGPKYSIFVGDLGPEVNEFVLVSLFQSRFPSCKSAKIMTDPISGMSRGYGFVHFSDEVDQQRALSEMQGVYCGNRPMHISTTTPPSRMSTHSSSSRSRLMTTKEIAAEKAKQDRKSAKSASKGVLGASGIEMFLEALENWDI